MKKKGGGNRRMMIVSSVVNQLHLVHVERPTTHPPRTRLSGAEIPYGKTKQSLQC